LAYRCLTVTLAVKSIYALIPQIPLIFEITIFPPKTMHIFKFHSVEKYSPFSSQTPVRTFPNSFSYFYFVFTLYYIWNVALTKKWDSIYLTRDIIPLYHFWILWNNKNNNKNNNKDTGNENEMMRKNKKEARWHARGH